MGVVDSTKANMNAVYYTTPIMGVAVMFLAATGTTRGVGMIGRAVGGAMTGGITAAGVEYTYNSSTHPASQKMNIIYGNAALGAMAAVVGPMIY